MKGVRIWAGGSSEAVRWDVVVHLATLLDCFAQGSEWRVRADVIMYNLLPKVKYLQSTITTFVLEYEYGLGMAAGRGRQTFKIVQAGAGHTRVHACHQ
jgi:hypothetical protein